MPSTQDGQGKHLEGDGLTASCIRSALAEHLSSTNPVVWVYIGYQYPLADGPAEYDRILGRPW